MIKKLEFQTKVDLNITGSHKEDPGHGSITIKWQLIFEQNLKGLSEMTIVVPDQSVGANINYFNESEVKHRVNKIIDIKNVKVNRSNTQHGIEPIQMDKHIDTFELYF